MSTRPRRGQGALETDPMVIAVVANTIGSANTKAGKASGRKGTTPSGPHLAVGTTTLVPRSKETGRLQDAS